jgi:hypothetical protein
MIFAVVSQSPSLFGTLALFFSGAILLIFCLFKVGRAISLSRTRRALERHGISTSGEVTDVRFKALNRLGKAYGLVLFTYHIDEKRYTRKQAVDEETGKMLIRDMQSVRVLYLPDTPRVAKLGYVFSNTQLVFEDPTAKILLYVLLMLPLALIALGIGIWMALSFS